MLTRYNTFGERVHFGKCLCMRLFDCFEVMSSCLNLAMIFLKARSFCDFFLDIIIPDNDYLSYIFGRRPFLAILSFHLPCGLLFLVGYAGRRLLFIVFSLAFFFATALSIALGGILDPHYDNFLELLPDF